MKKLEMKDIAAYLPYNLKCLGLYGDLWSVGQLRYALGKFEGDVGLVDEDEEDLWSDEHVHGLKPLIRSMDDLSKPLEDGTIPILELARIAEVEGLIKVNNGCAVFGYEFKDRFYWNGTDFVVDYWNLENYKAICNQLDLFDYLNKHNFDYRGLIDKGLAININEMEF